MTNLTNQSLLERRNAVLPNGLGVAFPIFAERAKNAELWDGRAAMLDAIYYDR